MNYHIVGILYALVVLIVIGVPILLIWLALNWVENMAKEIFSAVTDLADFVVNFHIGQQHIAKKLREVK